MADTAVDNPPVDNVAKSALSSALGSGNALADPLTRLMSQEREAQKKVEEGKYQQQMTEARGTQQAYGNFAADARSRYEAAKPELMAGPPKMDIHQDTQEGMMGLAALLPLAGILIGAKGNMSGINAMNAMSGVLKGYQEGNNERIAFEKQKYDAAMKEWDAHIKQVKDSLDKYMELGKYDLQRATAKAKADAIAKGHGVISDFIDQQGLTKTREMVEKLALEKEKQSARLGAISGASNMLDDDTARFQAERVLSGDKTALQGFGYGQVGAANRAKVTRYVQEIAKERGLSADQVAAKMQEYVGLGAAERAAGTQVSRVGTAAEEAYSLMQPALKASEAVPRGKFVPITKLQQMAESSMSDPSLARFKAANNALINTYVRAISPTGVPTDTVRTHAYDLLRTADSPEAYKAVVDQMRIEIDRARSAPIEFAKTLAAGWTGAGGLPTPPGKPNSQAVADDPLGIR